MDLIKATTEELKIFVYDASHEHARLTNVIRIANEEIEKRSKKVEPKLEPKVDVGS